MGNGACGNRHARINRRLTIRWRHEALSGRGLSSNVRAQSMTTKFSWYWSERMHRWWEHLRRRGVTHFVIVRGLLAWAGSMFAFFTLSPLLFYFPSNVTFTSALLLKIGVICIVGGLAWGLLTWYVNEFLYRKHI